MSAPTNAEPWTPAQWDEMRAYFTSTTHPLRWQLRAQRLFAQIDRVRDEAEHYGHTREALKETALGVARLAGQREGMEMAAGVLDGYADHTEKYGDGSLNHDPQRIRARVGELRVYAENLRERAAKIEAEEIET